MALVREVGVACTFSKSTADVKSGIYLKKLASQSFVTIHSLDATGAAAGAGLQVGDALVFHISIG